MYYTIVYLHFHNVPTALRQSRKKEHPGRREARTTARPKSMGHDAEHDILA